MIYQNDPSTPTFEDYILVRATADLPPNLRSSLNIAFRANEIYPLGAFISSQLNPIPDEVNTNWARPGSDPAPDLTDALVVYAATFLSDSTRTAENLASVINTLDPSIDPDLRALDIEAIPGDFLPPLPTPQFDPFDFDIDVRFPVRSDSRPLSNFERQAILRAVDYWESIFIAGDITLAQIPSTFLSNPQDCLGLPYTLPQGTSLISEDIIINFYINDQETSVASAGPCIYRGGGFGVGSYLPAFGSVVFNSSAIINFPFNDPEVFENIVRHEIGHVLGFGTILENPVLPSNIASYFANYNPSICRENESCLPPLDYNPLFIGPTSLSSYNSLRFSLGLNPANGVPIEDCSGISGFTCTGLRNVNRHWKESVFGAELMTTLIDVNVPVRISQATLSYFSDIGYPSVRPPAGGELHKLNDASSTGIAPENRSANQPSHIILDENSYPNTVYVVGANGENFN